MSTKMHKNEIWTSNQVENHPPSDMTSFTESHQATVKAAMKAIPSSNKTNVKKEVIIVKDMRLETSVLLSNPIFSKALILEHQTKKRDFLKNEIF